MVNSFMPQKREYLFIESAPSIQTFSDSECIPLEIGKKKFHAFTRNNLLTLKVSKMITPRSRKACAMRHSKKRALRCAASNSAMFVMLHAVIGVACTPNNSRTSKPPFFFAKSKGVPRSDLCKASALPPGACESCWRCHVVLPSAMHSIPACPACLHGL